MSNLIKVDRAQRHLMPLRSYMQRHQMQAMDYLIEEAEKVNFLHEEIDYLEEKIKKLLGGF